MKEGSRDGVRREEGGRERKRARGKEGGKNEWKENDSVRGG